MRRSRVDSNQDGIVKLLEEHGATVQKLTSNGHGCPDLLVGYGGRNFLMEIKTRRGKLNQEQLEWHGWWAGKVWVVREPIRAVVIIKLKEEPS